MENEDNQNIQDIQELKKAHIKFKKKIKKDKSSEIDLLMQKCRDDYKGWREKNRKTGFFLIYNHFHKDNILKEISGNALRLYIYLGIHSKNDTGETWHSAEKISDYFDCDERSVKRWFAELEEKKLIYRVQNGYKRIANTFLLPY
jgi:hypothetical protein